MSRTYDVATAHTVGELRHNLHGLPDKALLDKEVRLQATRHVDDPCEWRIAVACGAPDWRAQARDVVLGRLQHANDDDLPALVELLERLDGPRAPCRWDDLARHRRFCGGTYEPR